MRFRALATSCLLLAVSAGSMTTLAANPDCSRWIREYQDALAKRSVRAKRHVVRAARRLIIPHPRLLHASVPTHKKYSPKLSPAEMLRRFKILCGEDLPDDAVPAEFIPTSLTAELVQPSFPDASPLSDLGDAPAAFAPPAPVATATPAQTPAVTLVPLGSFTPNAPTAPPLPINSTSATGTPGSGTTSTGTTTGTGTTTTPSPVPEPSTLLLLMTGGTLGILPAIARRRHHLR